MNKCGRLEGTTRRRSRQGVALVLVAMLMVVIIAFASFVIDIGYIAVTKAELQNAADAASLAAARHLPTDITNARQAAVDVAALHIAGGQTVELNTRSHIEFGDWDEETATFTPGGTKNRVYSAVRVTCQRTGVNANPLSLFFAPVIGVSRADVSAQAVAQREGAPCGRFIGLEWIDAASGYTDSYNSDKGSYSSQAPGNEGNLCSDGVITLRNETVHGNANPGDGCAVVNKNSTVSGSTESHSRPIDAPLIDASAFIDANDNNAIPVAYYNPDTKGLRVTGGESVTFPGGVYYFSEIDINGEVNFTGPTTIYAAGTASITGRGIINHDIAPADLQLYCLGATARFAGSANFYGVIYGPTCDVVVTGNAEYFGCILGKTLRLTTNGGAHYDEALGYNNEYLDGSPELRQ